MKRPEASKRRSETASNSWVSPVCKSITDALSRTGSLLFSRSSGGRPTVQASQRPSAEKAGAEPHAKTRVESSASLRTRSSEVSSTRVTTYAIQSP